MSTVRSEYREFPRFTELAPGLYETQMWSANESARIVEAVMDQASWACATLNRGNLSNVIDPTVRAAETLSVSMTSTLLGTAHGRLATVTEHIAASLAGAPTTLCDVQIVRYGRGGFFTPHRDSSEHGPSRRAVTVLCYLNDEYSGGHLGFPELRVTYRPRAGALLVFPATYLHHAEVVSSGSKVLLVGWHEWASS